MFEMTSLCYLVFYLVAIYEFSLAVTELFMLLQILDCALGHNDALFRRAQLKALVSIHSQEVNLTQSEFLYVYSSINVGILCKGLENAKTTNYQVMPQIISAFSSYPNMVSLHF